MASTDTLWFAFLSEEKSAVRLRSRADLEAASRKVDVVFCGGEWKPIETVLEEATAPPTPRPGSASGVAATAGTPRNFTQHVSVKYDPLTGGLTGLPKAWEGLLPEGCSRDAVSYADVPAELRPTGVADPGLRLKDELLVGAPFNVQKWRPSFGLSPSRRSRRPLAQGPSERLLGADSCRRAGRAGGDDPDARLQHPDRAADAADRARRG